MDKLKDVEERQSVTNSLNQTVVGQRLVTDTRLVQPSRQAREAAAREAEMRWLWYLRLVVNKKNRSA